MKRFLLICAFLLAAGCAGEPESASTVGDFKVERLFTYDGVTVYRFSDARRYRYFASRGVVDSHFDQTNGTYHHDSIQAVDR